MKKINPNLLVRRPDSLWEPDPRYLVEQERARLAKMLAGEEAEEPHPPFAKPPLYSRCDPE
jgi:hypothetical protein